MRLKRTGAQKKERKKQKKEKLIEKVEIKKKPKTSFLKRKQKLKNQSKKKKYEMILNSVNRLYNAKIDENKENRRKNWQRKK